jgi:hypothetical protein
MSSTEGPTFDPNKLPDDYILRMQAETDLGLVEQGMSPDEVAEVRVFVHERLEKLKEEDRRAVEQEFEDE